MFTRKEATLADLVIEEFGSARMRTVDPSRWLPRTIASARKFVLDDKMSAFSADLAYACLPPKPGDNRFYNIKRAKQMLENVRVAARLPHAVTWIEFSLQARYARVKELNADVVGNPDDCPGRSGWLMLQHPQVDTAFMAVECTSHSALDRGSMDKKLFISELGPLAPLVPRPNACPMAYCWTVDDSVPPWPLVGQQSGEAHIASAMLTGVLKYTVPQVGWSIAPWAFHSPRIIKMLTDKNFAAIQEQQSSDLRYIWALLSAINDTPVSYRAVTPTKGHLVGGNYKRFSSHTVVTLQVPHKITLAQLAKRVARAARRRAHQVRGHFRKDWRHPGEKIWIAEHQRGDASLGFVLHDYVVNHPTENSNA